MKQPSLELSFPFPQLTAQRIPGNNRNISVSRPIKEFSFPEKLEYKARDISLLHPGVELTKRLLDLLGAIFGLLMLSPVMIGVAIAIKVSSPGPVFFLQRRVGRNGREFNLIKFRSMRADAELKSGAVWAEEGRGKADPRVTPIGDFLRKSHLDEIPQLFLVLSGHMSLVGPRPERQVFVNQLEKRFPLFSERVVALKPGVTGIAQARRETDQNFTVAVEKRTENRGAETIFSEKSLRETNDKLLADFSYGILLSRATPLKALYIDLKILFLTVFNILKARS